MVYHANQQVFDAVPSQYVLCVIQGNNLPSPKYHPEVPVNYLLPTTDNVIHILVHYKVYFISQFIGNRLK